MTFWGVLGRRGCREKNVSTAISMQLFEVVFSTFGRQKIFKKNNDNILVSALESYMNASSFYKLQNVLCQYKMFFASPKCFVPVQK